MTDLTQEQRQELEQPEPMLRDPQTNETYVLVRKDVFERLRHLLGEEGPDRRELSLLVERAMREYDEDDPSLHLYQE
jgi:hypothetical protein